MQSNLRNLRNKTMCIEWNKCMNHQQGNTINKSYLSDHGRLWLANEDHPIQVNTEFVIRNMHLD